MLGEGAAEMWLMPDLPCEGSVQSDLGSLGAADARRGPR